MQAGLVGLGRMGGNMARRLAAAGHDLVIYNRTVARARELAATQERLVVAETLADLVGALPVPRVVWVMLPAGEPTESAVAELSGLLAPGDVIVDGGNSNYKDSMRRSEAAALSGLHYVDVGTSGGVWGLSEGYSLMVGGESTAVQQIRPLLEALAPAPDRGWAHVGPSGAGHFTKMVHNGIEYGLMQAYAEGFEILKSKTEFSLDLHQVAEVWRYGSVVRSWLLDLISAGLAEDSSLRNVRGWVQDSGEGRWTVAEAMANDVPAPIITMSLIMRLVSRQDESYAAKLLAVMRQQFGGHEVKPE